jgi:quercetin dioxygenase-like cupin family protein
MRSLPGCWPGRSTALRFVLPIDPIRDETPTSHAKKESPLHQLLKLTLSLVFVSALFVTNDAASHAAPPEPKPVTLECATDMQTQMRAYFGVGGGIGPHTHPGTLVVTVESGQFGVTLEEDSHMGMAVMRIDESGTPVEEMLVAGEETVLEPGDYFIETGMIHSARTVGDEPVVVTFTGVVETGQPVTTCV